MGQTDPPSSCQENEPHGLSITALPCKGKALLHHAQAACSTRCHRTPLRAELRKAQSRRMHPCRSLLFCTEDTAAAICSHGHVSEGSRPAGGGLLGQNALQTALTIHRCAWYPSALAVDSPDQTGLHKLCTAEQTYVHPTRHQKSSQSCKRVHWSLCPYNMQPLFVNGEYAPQGFLT